MVSRLALVIALMTGLSSSAFASTYVLTPVMSWTASEAYANSLGGHLVVINDQAEQDLLVSEFGGTETFWIGLNDLLVSFGQNLCRPTSPHCSRCPVRATCARIGVRRAR